ncbi:hypothetical protein ZIOFF_005107 [Zingiber officinale]|uniref:SKP1 component POZ domain-containing protein n=1 Tax=Zingiber officinale TaxID=94328 RepID=A0A8J5HLZ2_ZINOF|nr:hypothetical protein ZIOFF_005107 [Zingiber officinale]
MIEISTQESLVSPNIFTFNSSQPTYAMTFSPLVFPFLISPSPQSPFAILFLDSGRHDEDDHAEEQGHRDKDIPLPNVSSRILTKVVEYCKKHVIAVTSNSKSSFEDITRSMISDEDLKSCDTEFVKFNQVNLFD